MNSTHGQNLALHLDPRTKLTLIRTQGRHKLLKSGSKQNLVLILVQRPIELNSIEGQNEASYSDLRIKLGSNFSFKLGPHCRNFETQLDGKIKRLSKKRTLAL